MAPVRMASCMMSRKPIRPPPPISARSFANIVLATRQPSPTGPSRHVSGTRTSVRNTSLKCATPLIWKSTDLVGPYEWA